MVVEDHRSKGSLRTSTRCNLGRCGEPHAARTECIAHDRALVTSQSGKFIVTRFSGHRTTQVNCAIGTRGASAERRVLPYELKVQYK